MEIMPYESVGAVKFGMSPVEVVAVLGAPLVTTENFFGEPKLIYNDVVIEFDPLGATDITVDPSSEVTVRGQVIQNAPDGREVLLGLSKQRYRGNGSIILLDIGIAFPDDELPFPLTAFARGRMDQLLHTLEQM